MREILKDSHGRRIGEIETNGSRQILRDERGIRLSDYDGKVTRDVRGVKIGDNDAIKKIII